MSENNRPPVGPEEIANHPEVEELLERLGAQLGTNFFILGAGTPEQEEEHRVYLAAQAVERRKEEAEFARNNAVTPEVLAGIFACLAKK